MKKMIVRQKYSGMYHIKSLIHVMPWRTLDPKQATVQNDTEKVRAEFKRAYGENIEFITV